MGEASRRKKLGLYPEQTPKPIPKTRKKVLITGYGDSTLPLMLGLLAATRSYPRLPKED
jgi:hypothetical protein